jgi:diguanylate cyclase (GGDEF)-like protein/PAS domain S-box-containing protein
MSETLDFEGGININEYKFSDIFDLKEIQRLQDLFSAATGVASIITEIDGTPITRPSGFCSFCSEVVRKTEKGLTNCMKSDCIIGSMKRNGPRIQRCLSGGLMDGGASIIVQGKHIANWLVGQVVDEDFDLEDLMPYADVIGVERDVYRKELNKVKRMSKLQFENVCNFLFLNVQQLSRHIMKNVTLTHGLNRRLINEAKIKAINNELEIMVKERTIQLEESNSELEETNAMLEEEISERIRVEEEVNKLNSELEDKVMERTNELQDMNAALEEEIGERMLVAEDLNREKVFTETLFESIPGFLYVYDEYGNLIRWNKKHEEMTGYSGEELSHMNLGDWYDEEEYKRVSAAVKEVLNVGHGEIEAHLKIKSGEKLHVQVNGVRLINDGKTYLTGVGQDITKRKRDEEELKNSEAKHRAMIANISDVIAIIDIKGIIRYVSPNIEKWFGWLPEDHLNLECWGIVHPEDVERIQEEFYNLLGKYNSVLTREFKYKCKDGSYKLIELTAVNLIKDDNIKGLLINYHDITERKKWEEENLYLSYHDGLTNLYNRRFFEEEIRRLDIERNLPISIIMGDVNGLKLVNDAFGHYKGDELLQKAAVAIQSACRADDIVARWGGDEFVILLPKTKAEDAEEIVNRIKDLYSNEYVNAIRVSISFGWETKVKADEDILKAVKGAEDYMYKHKMIENESMRGNIITTILNTLHEKNPREEQHSKRVSEICQSIGKALGLSEIEIGKLKVVGLLHDIGKIAIEEGILNKTGRLTDKEMNEIKRHPDIGYRILSSSNDMLELADFTLAHHERWDGHGYPKGLKGEAIPRTSRILAIADSYDAMTSDRTYRKAQSEEVALDEIYKNAGLQFDPKIARVFVEKVLNKEWF